MTLTTVTSKMKIAKLMYILVYPAIRLLNLNLPERKLKAQFQIALQAALNGYSIANTRLLLKQSILEAGTNYDSKAVLEDNNVFGMGKVFKRPTLQTGSRIARDTTGRNYIGQYSSIGCSVADRIYWDQYNSVDPRSIQYLDRVIQQGYNQNTQYQFSWENTDVSGLTIAKVHVAVISMLVTGFIVTNFFLNKARR